MANINGWGRGTWGQLTFGEALPVVVTGVAGTTALDNGTAVQAAAVTGVTATTSTSGLGDESVSCAANVAVTLDAITSSLGNESLITNNYLDMTGLVGTTTLASVTTNANADIVVEGFEIISGTILGINVWGEVTTSQTPNYVTISTTQTPNYVTISTTQTPSWTDIIL